jgi:sporulation protein YlmC with PRC-barrel domain
VIVRQRDPEVIIEQADPEIQVEQPKPLVTVDQAQPHVNVQQPPPQVVIEQAPPQVQIQPAVPPAPPPEPMAAAPPPPEPATPPEPVPVAPPTPSPSPATAAVEQMIGKPVMNADGQEIGQVRDLLMSPDGSVSQAIIDVGGFLGVGNKQIAVPWNQIAVQPDGNSLTLSMDRQQLETAPDHEYAEGDNPLVGPTR